MAPKTPNIVLKQLRGSSVPQGFLLGRVSAGTGAVELVSLANAQANGLAPQPVTVLPLSGDVTGTTKASTVANLRGLLLSTTAPTDGQVLTWVAADSKLEWVASTVPTGANPTATAGAAAINGSATTFMRSDAAPAVAKASSSTFGIVEVDGTTITASGGVISAVAPTVPPSGPAGGDLSGTYPNPAVAQLRGLLLSSAAPSDGQVLTWVAADSEIEFKTPSGGGGISAAYAASLTSIGF